MNRFLTSVACALLTLGLLGCPPAESGQAPTQSETTLNLRMASATHAVGEEAALDLGFGQDGSALFGAMIADDADARLTQWHADPADAVVFNEDASTVKFTRSGKVRIWATWTDASGSELTSNEVELEIGGGEAPVPAADAPAESN